MKNSVLHRFFLPLNITTTDLTLLVNKKLNYDLFHQFFNVLRMQIGEEVIFLDPNKQNYEFLYKLIAKDKKEFIFRFQKKYQIHSELPYFISLFVALPAKSDTLSHIIQKATELGVSSISLIKTEFTQLRHPVNLQRLQKIAIEAAEQSGRGVIPIILDNTKINLENFLQKKPKNLIVALERDNSTLLKKDILNKFINKKQPYISVLIGPEGGFSQVEKELFQQSAVLTFTLGKIILRMETAVISALSIINFLLSD